MQSDVVFRRNDRVSITEKGRYDLLFHDECLCDVTLVGLLVQCADCGTIYGHLAELDRKVANSPRRRRW